jgi:hypothetical protein
VIVGVKSSNEQEQRIAQEQRQNEEAIKTHRVLSGMTKEQVIRAWGQPTKINYIAGREQWVYEGENANDVYLYFDNGRATKVHRVKGFDSP